MHKIDLETTKKIFFVSDLHLGAPNVHKSQARERLFTRFLNENKDQMAAVFVVGDLFDVWFEYHALVPKGYSRTIGKLAELADSGIEIFVFWGNHDSWQMNYLAEEIGCKVFPDEFIFESNGKRFYVSHGDGIGPGDENYKILKKILRNPTTNWLFRNIMPAKWGLKLMTILSNRSWKSSGKEGFGHFNQNAEYQIAFANDYLKTNEIDHFVFGHRHLLAQANIDKGAIYSNIGDWINFNSYGVWDGKEMKLGKITS